MTSVYACLKGLLDAAPGNGIQLVALLTTKKWEAGQSKVLLLWRFPIY